MEGGDDGMRIVLSISFSFFHSLLLASLSL